MKVNSELISFIREKAVIGMKQMAVEKNQPIINPLAEPADELEDIINYLLECTPDDDDHQNLSPILRAILDSDDKISVLDLLTKGDYRNMALDIYHELYEDFRLDIASVLFKQLESKGEILSYDDAKKFIKLYRLKSEKAYKDWYDFYMPSFLPKNPEVHYSTHR